MIRLLTIFLSLLALCAKAEAATLCTVIADTASRKILLQQGDCTRRVTPASTFKIAVSLMGADTGFITGEHTPALPYKPGYPDALPAWRQTTDPTAWLKYSVVWYSPADHPIPRRTPLRPLRPRFPLRKRRRLRQPRQT